MGLAAHQIDSDPGTHQRKHSMPGKTYSIPRRELRRLYQRAHRAQRKNQSEVAGALMLNDGHVLTLEFMRNRSDRPGHFELSRESLTELRREARREGRRVVGLFHSHPITEPEPGKNDLRDASVNSLMLIYDVCGRSAKLWRVRRKGGKKVAVEVPLSIETNTDRDLK